MTQPTERRFVMEPRLDAEVEALNDTLATKVDTTDARLSDQRVPLDNSVTSAKIANGAIVDADVNASAAIAPSKILGTAVTQADTQSITSTMIVDGTIVNGDIANNTIESAKLAEQDYIKFDTTYAGGSTQPGMVVWNDADGTLEFELKGGNVTLQIGQEQVVRVKNDTGAALSNGKAVYISGSNGTNLLAAYANAGAENTSAGTIGIATEDISNNGHGFVTTFGLVRNINTAGLTEGAPVWLATSNGGLTSTRPTAPNHSVMLGFCLRASATVGVIFVRVDNGWELDELHNVLITSPTNGQALTYDSASGIWKNATPVNSLSGLSDVTITSPSGGQVVKYDSGISKWVNGPAAGGVTAAASAPSLSTAAAGDAWFDTNDGTLYVCYVDTDSTKQWVQVQANSALEGSILARLGSLESQAIAMGAMSPNYVINGGFDIWQRGTSQSSWANGISTADRWNLNSSASTLWSQDTTTAFPGCRYGVKATIGASAASVQAYQCFETSHTYPLIGKTVTLSGYANSTVATSIIARIEYSTTVDAPLIGGGSGWVSIGDSTTAILPNTVTRVSTTQVIPSSAKSIRISIQAASTASGAVISFSGVQLEAGSTATSFRRNAPSIQAELAACQRYYFRFTQEENYQSIAIAYLWGAGEIIFHYYLPVQLRKMPTTVTYSAPSATYFLGNGTNYSGATNATQVWGSRNQLSFLFTNTGAGINQSAHARPPLNSFFAADAEL